LADLIGHVDARDRPLLLLSLPGQDDDLLVTVDTGFNGQILVHDVPALRLSYESTGVDVWVEFADGARRTVQLASSSIIWFGRQRTVDLWIARATSPRHPIPDEPLGIIGTGLVSPHRLTIDFMTRRVVLSENED